MRETRSETMREDLTAAIAGCAAPGPLLERATSLFGVLGYHSERTGEAHNAAEFLQEYDGHDPRLSDKQRKLLLDAWRTVGIVFQFTDEEIGVIQASLFKDQGFEPGRIKSFLFLAVELVGDDYDRTRLAEMTRAVNRIFSMPVVVLFRHGGNLTLAMIHRRTHKGDDNRDVLERVTLVKGIHTDAPNRAHIEILADLELGRLVGTGVRSFDELHAAWERILDIEALNRRFYSELFSWFHRAVRECRFPDDGAGDGNAQRHVIRLITRLLFIWFLKEKGLAPEELFDESFARTTLKQHAPDRSDYYRAVIQNLFFATLNTEIGRRAFRPDTDPARRGKNPAYRDFSKYRYRGLLTDSGSFVRKLRSVPFVNGGLFDCLDEFPGGRRIDAFTDHPAQGKDLHVPARLFFDADGLFTLFHSYKFTVEENTPLDREVALDPELLGRVFENLLAAYNPETRETARKVTGSYYTPRHVVDYMVDEALVASLAQNVRPADSDAAYLRDRLRYLLDYEHAFDDAKDLFHPDETEAVVRAIAELRVLDPAVGSGAFPMGMLHKLTLALKRLDPHNRLWEELQKEHARHKTGEAFDAADRKERDDELLEISKTFEAYRDSDFGRKLYLIQNGIFGVDVQPIACQIAKLRFFISLVIEQQPTGDPKDNYGIRPLPNLETRFVAANTLIGLGRGDQRILGNDAIKGLEDRLRRVRERYFHARTRQTKLGLRKQDDALRNDLSQELERLDFDHAHARAVADWNPYDQNASASWFDTQWMFNLSEGFDVVIGNPPYVRADFQDDRHRATRQAIRACSEYETLWEKWDIFIPFMERSFKLLCDDGVSSLIVSDAFGGAKYALKAREWFLRNAFIERIDFFSKIKIFDAAVSNLSYLFRKSDGSNNTPLRHLHETTFGTVTKLSSGKQKDLDQRVFFYEDSVSLRHIEALKGNFNISRTIPLTKICYISYGLRPNANEKIAKRQFTTKDVVSNTKDRHHPKAFVEGKHLDRWVPVQNLWLEWGTGRAPALFSRRAFDELFAQGEKIIVQRSPGPDPKGCYDDNALCFDASCVGFVLWCDLEGVRNRSIRKQSRYRDETRSQILPQREKLEDNSRRFSIKYLLGVMNSISAHELLRAHRRSNIHLYPDDWKPLPIPDVPLHAQQPIIDLVDEILATKRANQNADVAAKEQRIDETVKALYGRTE